MTDDGGWTEGKGIKEVKEGKRDKGKANVGRLKE